MIEVAFQEYPDRDTLMRGLAELVADQLRAAQASRHHRTPKADRRVTLAVPGGTTPRPFLEALSEADLAWPDVDVILTDERLVDDSDPRSNSRLLRKALLRGPAASARFVDFHTADPQGDRAMPTLRGRLAAVLPIDVLVLGMGGDMHTASLFPHAPGLADALATDAPVLLRTRPEDQPEDRLTLSAPVLRAAGVIHILITGPEKRAALETALADGPIEDAPVRVALTAPCPVTVHYAD